MDDDLAIIGCGYWGKNIIRVISELKKEKVFNGNVFLYDKDLDKAKKLTEQYQFPTISSYKKILTSKNICSVLIITPSSTHYELTKEALLAGKNVYVEKPFTLDSKEAEELVEISTSKDLILMIGHLFRFHQGILELKKRLDLGELGKILFMYGTKFGYSVPKEDAGVIFTIAVNDLDIFCFLTGNEYPTSISVQKGSFLQENIEEIASLNVNFPKGIQCYYTASWLIPIYERHRELYVVGTEKTAVIDYLKPNEIMIYDAKIMKEKIDQRILFKMEKNPVQKIIFKFKEPLKEELKHFVMCINEQVEPITNGKLGYRAIKMCEIALKSAALGKEMFFSDE